MAISAQRKLQRWCYKLDAIRREQQRQMGIAGERLGVMQRLKELAREERRAVNKITTLDPDFASFLTKRDEPEREREDPVAPTVTGDGDA